MKQLEKKKQDKCPEKEEKKKTKDRSVSNGFDNDKGKVSEKHKMSDLRIMISLVRFIQTEEWNVELRKKARPLTEKSPER